MVGVDTKTAAAAGVLRKVWKVAGEIYAHRPRFGVLSLLLAGMAGGFFVMVATHVDRPNYITCPTRPAATTPSGPVSGRTPTPLPGPPVVPSR